MEAWTPYQHPQLDWSEIWRPESEIHRGKLSNAFLLQEVEKTTKFCLRYAQSLPQLAIDKTNVNWLGADLAEVTVTISNAGYLPTYLSREGSFWARPDQSRFRCRGLKASSPGMRLWKSAIWKAIPASTPSIVPVSHHRRSRAADALHCAGWCRRAGGGDHDYRIPAESRPCSRKACVVNGCGLEFKIRSNRGN